MRIAKIAVRNVCGIREIDYEPTSGVTEVSGDNGVGKSSFLRGLQTVLKGGKDGRLLTNGQDKGEYVIVFDDETIAKTTWERDADGAVKVKRTLKPQGGRAVDGIQAYLDKLFDDLVNPIEFLESPKDRQRWLLEAVPLKCTAAELAAAVDGTVSAPFESLAQQHALIAIDSLHDLAYEARRTANVEATSKRQTIDQLSAGLPPEDEEADDWAAIASALDRRLGELTSAATAKISAAQSVRDNDFSAAESELQGKKLEITNRINAEIERLRAQGNAELLAAAQHCMSKKQEADRVEESAKSGARLEVAVEREQISAELAEAQAKRKEAERTVTTRQLRDRMAVEADALNAKWNRLEQAVNRLRELRDRQLDRIPIAGIETKGKELFKNGVPFDILNTAQQIEIAMEVAELRAGVGGLIAADGIERLSPETYAQLVRRAEESGLQWIFSRVTDGPLNIRPITSGEIAERQNIPARDLANA